MTQDKKQVEDTTPWKPADLLTVPEDLKDSRFVYRWCSKNKTGNIQKKLQEGWIIDNDILPKMIERGLFSKPTVNDSQPDGTVYHMRELVLMKLPKERAAARAKFYRERTERTQSRPKDEYEKEAGSRTYGKYKINK